MKVEVLAISSVMDLETGKPLTVVAFGKNIRVNDKVVERAKVAGTQVSPNSEQIGATVLNMFYAFGKIVPYRVGSVWNLFVDEKGNITLKEIQK